MPRPRIAALWLALIPACSGRPLGDDTASGTSTTATSGASATTTTTSTSTTTATGTSPTTSTGAGGTDSPGASTSTGGAGSDTSTGPATGGIEATTGTTTDTTGPVSGGPTATTLDSSTTDVPCEEWELLVQPVRPDSCVVMLTESVFFPKFVKVKIDGVVLPRLDDCAGSDGWMFVRPEPYDTIELCGAACESLMIAGEAVVQHYCPTG